MTCEYGSLDLSSNQLVGGVPGTLGVAFPTAFASNCLANVTAAMYAGCELTERPGLVDLYVATNGGAWTVSAGWLSSLHPCSWFGVTCLTSSSGPVL